MDLKLSLSGAPEMVAHDLLIAAFDAISAISSRGSSDTEALGDCQIEVSRAVARLREIHPYLKNGS